MKGPFEFHLDEIWRFEHQQIQKKQPLSHIVNLSVFLGQFSIKTHVQATKGQHTLTKIILIKKLTLRAATKNILIYSFWL